MSNKDCRKLSYIYYIHLEDSQVCAAGVSNPSSNICGGDSGGPLVVDKDNSAVVYGIASWRDRRSCGDGYASVFTRVSSYIPWIKSHMESSK